jgi:hypothetical protein
MATIEDDIFCGYADNVGRDGQLAFFVHAGCVERDDEGKPRRWKRHVQVSVSPAGRSVRVWVDGTEIPTYPSTGDNE